MNYEPYLDIVLRCVGVYLFMLVALRVFGKKELSQLNTFDVILILLISNAVQNAMVGPDVSLAGGLCAAAVLFLLNFLLKKLIRKSAVFADVLSGKPYILVHDGKADFKTLAKLDIASDELMQAIREHGVEHITDVKLAMLEPDGNISIISGTNPLRQTHHKKKVHRRMV